MSGYYWHRDPAEGRLAILLDAMLIGAHLHLWGIPVWRLAPEEWRIGHLYLSAPLTGTSAARELAALHTDPAGGTRTSDGLGTLPTLAYHG